MNGRGWMIGLLAVLLAGLSGCGATEAAERVTLVVGNSEYAHAPSLSNPKRDAEAIARALSGLGFEVTGPLLNQSKAQMDAALKGFRRRAQGARAAVVYFSGHGMEVGGQNYLIPQDAVLERDSDVSLEAVGLNVVLDQMGGVSGYRLVILDACRDNPLANNMERANGTKATYRGLAPIDPSGQTYVAYAARAGQRSQDGAAGGHSPYAEALLKYLPQPGLPLERLFGSVREEVLKATTQTQEPALYGTFGREAIYLVGSEPPAVTAPPVAAQAPAPVSPPAVPTPAVDHDLIAWQSAEKCGKAACFQAYLTDYPKGRYARMAQAQLEPEPTPAPAPVVVTPAPVEQPRSGMTGPAMVKITGGCFEMGSPAKETGREPDEMQHRVCVSDFELAPTELTVGEFKRFVTATGYQTDAEKNAGGNKGCDIGLEKIEYKAGYSWRKPGYKQGDDYPVVCVSWNDAIAYIQWFSQQTGQSYRLPTEAEWEYAARAGTTTARHWGDSPKQACQYANVADRAESPTGMVWKEQHECSDGYWYPAPVRKFRANPWGLYDMLGNVWEWTCSAYNKDYGGSEKECTNNVMARSLAVRGGGWYSQPAWVRSADRDGTTPACRGSGTSGFRLARSL